MNMRINVITITLKRKPIGRSHQPEIKAKLLETCTEFCLQHGLPNQIDPLASATGTSARMLVYHFGTRDDLLREILVRARQRQIETFTQLLAPRNRESYLETLANAWKAISGRPGQPYLRIFTRLRESDGEKLWPGFKRQATTDWLPPLTAGLTSIGRPELATLVLAVIRGLLLDLDATGNKVRTSEAFKQFLEALDEKAQ